MRPKKLSDDEVQATLTRAVRAAVNFVESEVAPERLRALRYFKGETDLGVEDGRHKIVDTVCRDAVRAIKPGLMRTFLQNDKPVEFVPRHASAVQAAEQATAYARAVFDENDGFLLIADAFHDALVAKVGILKVTFDETPEVEVDRYSGLPPEALALIEGEDGVEVLDTPEMGADGTLSLTVAKTSTKGAIRIVPVPPESFFINREATSIRDARVCGHLSEVTVGDVVAMGFDFAEVIDLAGDEDTTVSEEAELQRKGWSEDDDEDAIDPTARPFLLGEAYMRMDIEGTGVPRTYKFITGGDDYTILDRQLCDMNPFAVFEVDPEPHAFFGRSLVDLIIEDQDAATALLRGLLDSIALANTPRTEAVDGQVNFDDLLNNEVGGIVRVKQPGMLREIKMGMDASALLPALQHYDAVIDQKTGVTGAAMGMDGEALQGKTVVGVNAAVQAATAQPELVARFLAQGMKQVFEKIIALARQHPDPEAVVEVSGQFVPMDPRSWRAPMGMRVNVGLGTGRHEERAMALMQNLQMQMQVWAQGGGPNNGLVSLTHIRNSLADILAHGGVTNADRYWLPMDPQREQQVLAAAAQAAQAQGQQGNPLVQAETIKAQAKAQGDAAKLQLDGQRAQADFAIEAMKLKASDDLARDRMAQEMALKAADLQGKYALAVDQNAIRREQAAARPAPGATQSSAGSAPPR